MYFMFQQKHKFWMKKSHNFPLMILPAVLGLHKQKEEGMTESLLEDILQKDKDGLIKDKCTKVF